MLAKIAFQEKVKFLNILVLRTSVDRTIFHLFGELDKKNQIDCLIQSSQKERYEQVFPYIRFMDIRGEKFESIPMEVMQSIGKKTYGAVYIPLSGEHAYNFGNVIKIISELNYENAFFYNCNGKLSKIPKPNRSEDLLMRIIIFCLDRWYRFRER